MSQLKLNKQRYEPESDLKRLKHIFQISHQGYPAMKEYKCIRCGSFVKGNLRYEFVPDFFYKVEKFIEKHSECKGVDKNENT